MGRRKAPIRRAGQPNFRSKFEQDFAAKLTANELTYTFETDKLTYVTTRNYIPDFTLAPNIFVETKGRFLAADRAKHIQVRKQNPSAVIVFVFMNPHITISKASKTTYANWADKNNFLWTTTDKAVPFLKNLMKKHRA